MRRALLATFAAGLVAAFVLSSALADASFGDPAGDAADAPDVTAVAVSHDTAGNILFHVAAANFTPESTVTLWLDTDRNGSTGDAGFDYQLALGLSADPGQTGWWLGQWNGTAWDEAAQRSTVSVYSSSSYVDFRINASDLGGTSAFAFQVWTKRYVADAVTARDYAPDDSSATWTYDLSGAEPPTTTTQPTPTPPPLKIIVLGPKKLTVAAPVSTPARPVAGKRFTVTFMVTLNSSGGGNVMMEFVRAGKMICDPSIAGKVIRHSESFKNGGAKLSFVVPKNARGKLLKVKVTIKAKNQSATKVATYRVR